MKKYVIMGISLIVVIICSIWIYQYFRIKNAKIEVVLEDNLNVEFLDKVKVSDFIKSINGKIIDDYIIDTTEIGKQKISFKFINDENIQVEYSYDIEVIDSIPPLVWLNNSYNVNVGSDDTLIQDILCGDNYDSNPICQIVGEYDLNEVGSYNLVFKATDSSGNITEKEFVLNVKKPSSSGSNSSSGIVNKTDFNDVIDNYKNANTEIGIDVSKWQGDIDFEALKNAGVEFVIIRVGTADGIDGDYLLDSKFEQNIKGANAADIPVGIYFYSYANSNKRAKADAKWVIEQLEGHEIDLPIAFDWENWSFYNEFNLSFFELSDMVDSFLNVVNNAGYEGMLYSSKAYLENIWLELEYPVWLAHYTKNTNYAGKYTYWQLCNNGRVDGINGDVDINIRYLNATE